MKCQCKTKYTYFLMKRIVNVKIRIMSLLQYYTRRKENCLPPMTYSWTVTRAKSENNRLRKAYIWLKDYDTIPVDLTKFRRAQSQSQLKKVSDRYKKKKSPLWNHFLNNKNISCFNPKDSPIKNTEIRHITCFAPFLFMLFILRREAKRAA